MLEPTQLDAAWTCPELILHHFLISADNCSNLTGDAPAFAQCFWWALMNSLMMRKRALLTWARMVYLCRQISLSHRQRDRADD